MNKKVLEVLEYNKIIEMLVEKATSNPGRELCRELLPSIHLDEINQAQLETSHALDRLFKKGSTSFGGNKPLGMAIRSLEIGSVLSIVELLTIAAFLENCGRIKTYGKKEQPDLPNDSLTELFEQLEPIFPLSSEIRRCILSEEELSDDASTNLRSIRRNQSITKERIQTELTKMVNGSFRTYLQDPVITMRNNRYCIPVKAENKGFVKGMIHDQSSSGSTLFIEPAAIVELNNKLKELSMEEVSEIEIILSNLSLQVREHCDALFLNQKLMTKLDFVFAKAALALDLNATKPIFNEDHVIDIRKARHPLISKKVVVPIDIRIGKEFDLLMITGPNTGGKTVSLKTTGLFTLMGQAGLHIPAADRSMLSVFHEVFADIGDEQSIEQSLSTFSSHMTRIVSILKNADEHSLCLFDELGAGTDPTEGAALAIAILSTLHEKGIRTIATTHYSELKVFALSTPFVENACCEFDVESLKPTYKLLIGIPGKSNAFAISSKLGLPDDIIYRAKQSISEENTSFEDLLSDLEKNRIAIEKEKLEIAGHKEEIARLKKELQEKQEKLNASKDKILRNANEEARLILQDAKQVADDTIKTFQKAKLDAPIKDLEQTRATVRNKISKQNEKLSVTNKVAPKKQLKPNQLKLGDSVKIISMGLKGTVSSLPDARGNLFVQCGIIRSTTNISDLILIDEPTISGATSYAKSSSSKMRMSKSFSISSEINLLGKTVDEAIAALDKYLDDAYLAHLPSVRIVHGKGTGALRNAVHRHLKNIKYVTSFRLGEFGEGDAGVTIALFKEK